MNHQFICTLACKSINANVYKTQETLHIANVPNVRNKVEDCRHILCTICAGINMFKLLPENKSSIRKKKPKLNPFNILDAHCFLEK